MAQIWAGVDVGRTHHHCVVIDSEGKRLLSRRIANDETELLRLMGDAADFGDQATWAMDVPDGGAALLIGLLVAHDQRLLYLPGRALNRAAGGYRGEGKTDSRDATIIADQARMRRDLRSLRPGDEVIVELKLLTARRSDLVADRTRVINRLRGLLVGIFPALDRALEDLTRTGQLMLLTGYQTPAALRRIGLARLGCWLRTRKARHADKIAAAAVAAAHQQHIRLPGEALTATVIAELAKEVMALNDQIKKTERLIETRFRQHELAEVITSLPGFGSLLGAEFLAVTGGDMASFATPDRLAAFAGLAPAPWDSGRIRGNLHRPRRYHRGLNRVFYMSAMVSITCCPESRRFYDRKRVEGKRHNQAVLALARRRVNVVWALIRDHRVYQPSPAATAAA
ncbi:IS110 family transposase [Nocardia sp. NPDC058499]|uniref:IS110 family transposase n=1 Tax=Nocardia sp. NPDC058499 TaxID=3346530 RepID=UPI00365C7002